MQRGAPAGGPRVLLGLHPDSCRVLCRLTPRFATLGRRLDRAKANGEASVDVLIVLLSFGLFNQAQGGGARRAAPTARRHHKQQRGRGGPRPPPTTPVGGREQAGGPPPARPFFQKGAR